MMRVIKVYGSLAKFLGQRSFKAAVSSPIEAIRFLLANFPQAEAHIAQHDYKISVGRNPLQIGEQPELLTYPTAESEPIRIIPVVEGAGANGAQIAIGIGLVALALINPFGAAAIGTFGGAPLAVSSLVGTVGVGLALTGVAGLIAPTASTPTGVDSSYDPRKSYSFSGVQNVGRQGVPVPVVYGEVMVGSVVISSGVDTESVRV